MMARDTVQTVDRRSGSTPPEQTPSFTAEAARVLTEEVKADAAALWSKLLRLYEGGAHKSLGYASWGAYYEAEFGESSRRGYQILEAARVVEALAPVNHGSVTPRERVARELAPVLSENPERVEEVWAEVVQLHGPEPTAAEVRTHVRARSEHSQAATPTDTQVNRYAFVTEMRFHHDASDQAAAEAWARHLVERVTRSGAVCIYKNTRSV